MRSAIDWIFKKLGYVRNGLLEQVAFAALFELGEPLQVDESLQRDITNLRMQGCCVDAEIGENGFLLASIVTADGKIYGH